MSKYVGSVDKVIKAIEKMSKDPNYQRLDPVKDQDSLINWLMKAVWNAGSNLNIGPGLYCDGLSREYTPNEIYSISIKFCEGEISKEEAKERLRERHKELERVIMNEMGYKYDKKFHIYVKLEQQKSIKRRRRILRK